MLSTLRVFEVDFSVSVCLTSCLSCVSLSVWYKTEHVVRGVACRYRKAPQHVFPAAYKDCLAVTRYVVKNAQSLGVRRDAIIVAGDGAGGNLAAAVALALRDKLTMQVAISGYIYI